MDKTTVSFPLGGLALVESVEKRFGVFSTIFGGLGGRARDFIPLVKFHVCNRLTHSVSVNQLLAVYPAELLERLGAEKPSSERSLNRTLERIGKSFPIELLRYQNLIKLHGLADRIQVIDFSSTYLDGESELAKLGHSRDHRPDKPQITFGIATGLNAVPTALTIQAGNVQDKTHMKTMLRLVPNLLLPGSLLIFDCGGSTKKNKARILELGYNYLTFKPKHVGPYAKLIKYFGENIELATNCEINGRHYSCVKKKPEEEGGREVLYICFCPELHEGQLKAKERKFERQKEKGNKTLKARKRPILPSDKGWVHLLPSLQRTLPAGKVENPYITGIEGFFVLESSVDAEPEKILRLYKKRDTAEKFFRAMKEGVELRPIRHWSPNAVIGIFFVSFLANFLINLTVLLAKKAEAENAANTPLVPGRTESQLVTNAKLLKKFLISLTLTVVYPKDGFRFTVLSNVTFPNRFWPCWGILCGGTRTRASLYAGKPPRP